MAGLWMLMSLLMGLLSIYALFAVISYVHWKRNHAYVLEQKLDRLIALLEKQ